MKTLILILSIVLVTVFNCFSQTDTTINFVDYDSDGNIDTTDCYFANNPIVFWAVDSIYTINFNVQVSHIKLSSFYSKISILAYTIRTISGIDSSVRLDSTFYYSSIPDSNVISLNLFLNPSDSSWDDMVIISGTTSPTQISPINSLRNTTFNSAISVYPNPATDLIFIDRGIYFEGTKICITNSLSQTVYESYIHSQTTAIDLKNYISSGICFITLTNENNSFTETKKIVLK